MATPLPHADAMWTLLQVLTDPDAAAARLKEIQEQTAALDARIREVGVVGEIEALRAQARADRQMAAEAVALARQEAGRLMEAARMEQAAARAETEALRQSVTAERTALDQAIGTAAAEATARATALTVREAAVTQAEAQVAQATRESDRLRETLTTRLETLRAATQAVAG